MACCAMSGTALRCDTGCMVRACLISNWTVHLNYYSSNGLSRETLCWPCVTNPMLEGRVTAAFFLVCRCSWAEIILIWLASLLDFVEFVLMKLGLWSGEYVFYWPDGADTVVGHNC